ncbi:MAG: peptide ABC transporter substrate-binding protein [Candidatus Eremiobacteraeota bacterium]|nr:peptide ABC transporter substrate-binding protein [Candidatus Eremiobacteraeota bacterium]
MKRACSFVLLGALLCACTKTTGGAEGGRANAWTKPHVLTISDAGDVNTLNPHLGQFNDVGYLSEMTMAWLVKVDEHNNLYPELATEVPTTANGGVSKDGLTITYHLRKGVKWSDGAPFDADDVVFSTNVVNNLANNEVGRLGWDQITKIDEPDKYTVVYHMKSRYSPFVETFFATAGANPCILPKHLLAKYPNINDVPYNSLPVGIGPFKYKAWLRSDRVELVANPLYFRGRPKLDEVIFKIIPDRNTLLSQLQAHEVDMWYQFGGLYLQRTAAIPGYSILRQPGFIYGHLDFNVTHPGLNDPVVRQALRMAINRPELIQKIGHGVGILQDVTTPVTAVYAVKDLGVTAFDVAKASAMLDQDGWKRGSDGIREKNGAKLAFDFATSAGTPDADNQIELIRSTWSQIGVQIAVKRYPPNLMFAPIENGGIVYSNKYDMILFAWSNDAIGDYSSIYSCKSFPPNGQNNMRWCNPQAQAAMDALFTHFDQQQRNADVHSFEAAYVKDVPSIVISLHEDLYAYNSDLKNYHPNNISPFDNMMDVDI